MNKTDEALASILNSLASKFGTTVDHLYAIMIKQALIDGVESLVSILILVPIAIFLCLKIHKDRLAYNKVNASSYNNYYEDNILLTIITALVCISAISVFFFGGINAIDAFSNPEYYALRQIINK